MTAVTFSINGTSSTTVSGLVVRDVQRPLLGVRRDVFDTVPGREGSWLFEDQPGDKEISIACAFTVADNSAIRTAAGTLAALINGAGRSQLIISDQSDRFWYGRFSEMSTPREERGFAEFDLTFRCDPYAYSTSVSTQVLGPTSTEPYSTTFSVTTAADTAFTLEIAPTADLTSGFSIDVNGDVLTYGETLASGATLVISSVSHTAVIGSSLSMANLSGTFGRLISGTNSITFDRASGTASTTLTFTWRRRYL